MSRIIKFRALCTADGEEKMVYFGPQIFDNGLFAWPMPNDVSHIDEYLSPLLQFTGLHDKNGKEIYEGDILKDGSIKYPYLREVYWDDRFQWSLKLTHNNQFSQFLSNDKYVIPEEMRNHIVGNRFENPELLNPNTNENNS